MASGDIDSMHTGEKVVIGGLLIQIVVFSFFVISSAIFHIRLLRSPTPRSHDTPWRKHLSALYAASALVLVRSILRAIEYIQGNDGYILRHEPFLYVFDALLMLAVMVIFNVIHPSEIKALLRDTKAEGSHLEGGYRLQHSSRSSMLEMNGRPAC